MPGVAVIGAGIAGLTAAYRLRSEGIDAAVFEAAARTGGVIQSERSEGFLVEYGPNSVQSKTRTLERLIAELNLDSERVDAAEAARHRYVVQGGQAVAVPASPAKLITSPFFGIGAKLRLLREPFIPPADPGSDESVADFVRRRLGQEFLDYAVNPFVAGVYAGDPKKLSMKHSFSRVYDMEQTAGSILKAGLSRRSPGGDARRRMFTFRNGMERLPQAITAVLGDTVSLGTPVKLIARYGKAFEVNDQVFDAVVCAAPLHRLKQLTLPHEVDLAPLANVPYPPLSIVSLGYRRGDVQHPLEGFGMLVPGVEQGFSILGALFTSSIFPGRAPADHVLITSFVGGSRAPQAARQRAEELYDSVGQDLSRLLGASGQPVFRRHTYLEHSIPQYNVGYGSVLDAIGAVEERLPGWFMAGNYRNGVSVGEAAESGDRAATKCADLLSG